MRRRARAATTAASLLALCAPAQASLYVVETDAEKRILVVDPFSRRAMETLGDLNGVGNQYARANAPVLSIDNALSRATFEHPDYGTAFTARRTISFDLDALIRQVDAAMDPYRKNGCSKFKISSPYVTSVGAHMMKLRVDMSFKKRACDNILGTHNIATGHGHAIIAAQLRSVGDAPVLAFEAEDIDIDTDTVLGINPNSMFGRIVRLLTIDLARLLGSLNPVRGTIGELQFKLAQPLTRLAKKESIDAAQLRYSSSQIDDIVRGYGSLSRMLGNAEAWKLAFTLPASGFTRRPEYRLRPEFAGEKDPRLCSEMGAGGLSGYYCVPTGETRLVLRIVQTTLYSEDAREFIDSYYTGEGVYLSSLSDETMLKFYPAQTQAARIVDENYLSQSFRPFFLKNNPKPSCARETSPGRALSVGQSLCAYRLVPAWRKLPLAAQ